MLMLVLPFSLLARRRREPPREKTVRDSLLGEVTVRRLTEQDTVTGEDEIERVDVITGGIGMNNLGRRKKMPEE
jgi:hypothetical protein